MDRSLCMNCGDRHFACWDKCEKYLAVKNSKKMIQNEADIYLWAKPKYYKTKYGWRR